MGGGAAIIGPDTQYVAGPSGPDDAMLTGTIDLARVTEARLLLDTDGHYSRPDIFTLQVDRRPRRNVEDA